MLEDATRIWTNSLFFFPALQTSTHRCPPMDQGFLSASTVPKKNVSRNKMVCLASKTETFKQTCHLPPKRPLSRFPPAWFSTCLRFPSSRFLLQRCGLAVGQQGQSVQGLAEPRGERTQCLGGFIECCLLICCFLIVSC